MKVTAVLAVLATASVVVASNGHDSSVSARHAKVARNAGNLPNPPLRKRCKARHTPAKVESSKAAEPTPVKAEPSPKPEVAAAAPKPEVTPAAPKPADPQPNSNSGETLNISGNCGGSGASKKTSATNGPNGRLDWLNCGINDGGWNPPRIEIGQLVALDLSASLSNGGSPFHACKAYIDKFYKYGGQYGIPPIMLASFAMQESSCNPATTGGGGEAGLMQLTHDKCGGAPGGNCYDPDYNIATGAKFFSQTLNNNGGDVLKSIGMYNGWFPGMTFGKATAASKSACCKCQQNLDYLQQFVNGWIQGINAYDSSNRLGKYFNLDVCN